jgi:hypothetical protein
MSAPPSLSSVSLISITILSSTFPAAHAETISRIFIPASASATEAAVIPAHREPPSACSTSIKISIAARG